MLGIDPSARWVLARTALKLGLLLLFAVAQWPWGGFVQTLETLLLVAAFLDGIIALVRRERFRSPVLTYWDETAFFLVCGLGVRCLL